MRSRAALPVLAAVLVAVCAAVVPALLGGGPTPSVLTSADREAIGDPGVERGDDPPVVGRAPSAPEAVARAYLRGAHSTAPGQDGRSNRGGAAYAVPGSPAAAGGPVLNPPASGEWRVAAVDALEPAGTDPAGGRTAFVAHVRTTTAAPGTAPRIQRWRTRVVLHRDRDGRWLVAADTPVTPDTPDVND